MARIRSIKPEFWASAQVMESTRDARLLFIGIWNFVDDEGRMIYSPKRLKAQIFPSDDLTSADVHGMVSELARNKLVRLYTIENTQYLQVTGWHHQKISHPQKSKLPPPPPDDSVNTPGAFQPDLILSDPTESKPQLGSHSRSAPAREAAAAPSGNGQQKPARDLDHIERECRTAAGLTEDPSPGLFDLSALIGLLDRGFDLDRDIVPAIRAVAKAGRKGRTWAYYVQPILAAKEQHTKALNGSANGSSAPAADADLKNETADEREARFYRMWETWKRGTWPDSWGPDPKSAGCEIPKELIEKWSQP